MLRKSWIQAESYITCGGGKHLEAKPCLPPISVCSVSRLISLLIQCRSGFFSSVLPVLVVLLIGALLAFSLLNWLLKNENKAGLIVSLFALLFFSYGHVYDYGWQFGNFLQHRIFILLWTAVFTVGAILIVLGQRDARNLTKILNFISISLIVVSSSEILLHNFQTESYKYNLPDSENSGPTPRKTETETEMHPDIFYIILDGYGRTDVVRELYDYDNSDFEDYLRNRGFFVSQTSRANYCQTSLSVASSLNFSYIDDLIKKIDPESADRKPLKHLIENNQSLHFLKENHYEVITFSTGYSITDISLSDIHLGPNSGFWNEFHHEFLNTTPVAIIMDYLKIGFFQNELHRQRILHTFQHLVNLPDGNSPRFVFAHILLPHPPFLFDRHGNSINPGVPFDISDGSHFAKIRRENGYLTNHQQAYIHGYREQFLFATEKIKRAIDAILENSRIPPIIILQSDHGPGARLEWEHPDKTDFKERMAIFNAYYFPDKNYTQLYNGISPVNSFRVVFNTYFHRRLNLLPDRSFFSTFTQPYRFIQIDENAQIAR